MNIPQKALLVMTMSILAGCGSQPTPPDPMALVDAERAFAASAAQNGMRDAFLYYSTDDAVMFVPAAVKVKEHYMGATKRPGLLSWQPVYAEIASGGDLGWTTGPWDFRPEKATDSPVAYGQYNTIWKRQPDSTFRFVLDIGVAHGPHRSAPEGVTTRVLPFPEAIPATPPAPGGEELIRLEKEFSAASASQGVTAAYLPRIAADVRFCRMGRPAAQGVQDATAILGGLDGTLTWEAQAADIARNGDLGYTHGTATLSAHPSTTGFSFTHVWRRTQEGEWKLVLDVLIPLPPPEEITP